MFSSKERFRFDIVAIPGVTPDDPVEYGWVLVVVMSSTFQGKTEHTNVPVCLSVRTWPTVQEARNAADVLRKQDGIKLLTKATVSRGTVPPTCVGCTTTKPKV